jgi:hypothetical protein
VRPKIERTKDWTYLVHTEDGPLEVPSVTTIINAVVPKQLTYWGMKIGISGMLSATADQLMDCRMSSDPIATAAELLKAKHVSPWNYMENGRVIGAEVHTIIESFIKKGVWRDRAVTPNVSVRLDAFQKFLDENRPIFTASEVMTASLKHGYAGTFDAKCVFGAGKYRNYKALIDIKNTSNIYEDQYYPQLEAYEAAEIELGEEPTDVRLVVRLTDDGNYELGRSIDSLDDFLVLKQHWHSIQDRKLRKKLAKTK